MRLNVWQRIGVVASFAWALGGGIHQWVADVNRASEFSSLTYRTCSELRADAHDYNFAPCTAQSLKDYKTFLAGSWEDATFTALAPIPLAWLLAYAAIGIVKWVLAGRDSA
jgi:hypothetical protein